MKVVYSKYFPPKGFEAINLFGLIIGRSQYGKLSPRSLNHEKIHSHQIVEMLWIFFYIFYFSEWLVRLVQYQNAYTAYCNISFEREAYSNDKNLHYLNKRKPYTWLNYLIKHDAEN
ncbi:MAG: hypothetical protein RL662_2468 [Bacteroidota bacterium]|jgi:hypothetical protein